MAFAGGTSSLSVDWQERRRRHTEDLAQQWRETQAAKAAEHRHWHSAGNREDLPCRGSRYCNLARTAAKTTSTQRQPAWEKWRVQRATTQNATGRDRGKRSTTQKR